MGKTTIDWFSYDPEDGADFHATESEAREAAERSLDYERDEAADGWSDGVEEICWGRVLGRVQQTMRRPRTDDDVGIDPRCDEVVDYVVRDEPDETRDRLRAAEARVRKLEAERQPLLDVEQARAEAFEALLGELRKMMVDEPGGDLWATTRRNAISDAIAIIKGTDVRRVHPDDGGADVRQALLNELVNLGTVALTAEELAEIRAREPDVRDWVAADRSRLLAEVERLRAQLAEVRAIVGRMPHGRHLRKPDAGPCPVCRLVEITRRGARP